MSDTPIFDRMNEYGRYDKALDRKPNGTTRNGLGFFTRAVSAPQSPYAPDPHLDGPLHLIGAQNATEVPLDEEDEIYIASSSEQMVHGVAHWDKVQYIGEKITSYDSPHIQESAILNELKHDEDEQKKLKFLTSFVRRDINPVTASEKTHQFPRVDITGYVDKKIEGGLYAYLRASGQVMEAQYPSEGQEPQKGFKGLLDGILQDARQELPRGMSGIASILEPGEFTVERVCPDYDGPQQTVIAEITVRGENMIDDPEFIDVLLEQLIQQAKEKYPRHIPVSVDVLSPMDFREDGFTFRLKGVEGALPVYHPTFEGDKREDSVGSDVFSQTREESIVRLSQSPSEDPIPQYPFALPKPLFEMTEEHDEE